MTNEQNQYHSARTLLRNEQFPKKSNSANNSNGGRFRHKKGFFLSKTLKTIEGPFWKIGNSSKKSQSFGNNTEHSIRINKSQIELVDPINQFDFFSKTIIEFSWSIWWDSKKQDERPL